MPQLIRGKVMPASTHASSRRSGQSLGQRTACNGGREGKKEGSAALLVSPFIFGPGIFLATASGEREIGSCSADLLSLSLSLYLSSLPPIGGRLHMSVEEEEEGEGMGGSCRFLVAAAAAGQHSH